MKRILVILFFALLAYAGMAAAADPFYVLESHPQGEVAVLRITDPRSFAGLENVQILIFQNKGLSPVGMTQFYIQKDRYVVQPLLWMLGFDRTWQQPVPFGFPKVLTDGLVSVDAARSGITYDTADVRKGIIALALDYAPGAPTFWYGLAIDTTFQLQVKRLRPACPVPQIGYEFGCEPTPVSGLTSTSKTRAASLVHAEPRHIETLLNGQSVWYPEDESAGDIEKLLAAAVQAPE